MRDSNRTLAEQCADALEKAAESKSEALRAEKLAKRIFSQLVIEGAGSVALREHSARVNAKYISVEDDWLEKQRAANIEGAKSDGLAVRFSEWQSRNATARAEMQIR